MARPKKTVDKKEYQINLRLTKEELDTIDYVYQELKRYNREMTRSKAIIQTMEERATEIFQNRQKMEKGK